MSSNKIVKKSINVKIFFNSRKNLILSILSVAIVIIFLASSLMPFVGNSNMYPIITNGHAEVTPLNNSDNLSESSYVKYTLNLVNNTIMNGNIVSTGNGLNPYGALFDPANGYIYITNFVSNSISVINGETNKVVSIIPVGSWPYGIAFDSSNGYIYVTQYLSSSVSVINGTTNTVVTTIPVGLFPYDVAYGVIFDPSNGYIYVTSGSNVSVINGTTNTVVSKIPVGSSPSGLTFDPSNGYIYVTNEGSNNVSVINGETNKVVATIEAGLNPVAATFDPSNGYIYVLNKCSSWLLVINGANDSCVSTISVGVKSVAATFDPSNGYIYVTNEGSNSVCMINGTTNTVVSKIPVGLSPHGMAFDPSNSYIYVTNEGSHNVYIINGSIGINRVVSAISIGLSPHGMAFDPSNSYIYVTNEGSHNVSVINGETNKVITTIDVGSQPYGATFDSANGYIYVTNEGSHNVSVINGETNKVITTIDVGSAPVGVTFDSSNGYIYITNLGSNNVSVISGETNKVVATIDVGSQPYGATFDSANGYIYITNLASNNVSVISGETNKVVATIPVYSHPVAAAFDSSNGYIYVVNEYSCSVSVINGTTNKVISTIPVGSLPYGATFDSSNGYTYVTNYDSGSLSIISTIKSVASYSITFTESGLPSNTKWYLNLTNGMSSGAITSSYTFNLPNGTYMYSPSYINDYYVSNGSFTVNGSNISIHVNYLKYAHIKISVSPYSSLSINGVDATLTNGSFSEYLIQGYYYINATHSGYKPYTNLVYLKWNSTYNYNINLIPIKTYGYLTGTVYPVNATVTANGIAIPVINGFFNASLSPGTYYVTVTAPGYNGNISIVNILKNKTTSFTVKLTKSIKTFTISGYISPYSASLTVNGFAAYVNSTGYYSISVPSGNVTISAFESGYYTYSKTIDLTSSKIINIMLIKEPSATSTDVIKNITSLGYNVIIKNLAENNGYISMDYNATINGTVIVVLPYNDISNATISDIINSKVYIDNILYKNFTVTITSNGSAVLTVYNLDGDPALYWKYSPDASLPSYYNITFTESGLTSNTKWSVTLDGITESSTSNTIVFSETNGTYLYKANNVSGYKVSLSGSLTVNGRNITQAVTFTHITAKAAPSKLSGISGTELYAIIGAVAVIAIIGAGLVLIRKKK